VSVNRVTKEVVELSVFAIVVVGDENGVVGHGLGKSKDVSEAIAKAVEDAKKFSKIPLRPGISTHEQKVNLVVRVYLNSCVTW
jgi:small subunit ribosomal protein S5